MATRDPVGRARAVVRVARPTTERDRERRRVLALLAPFFTLATIGAFVPLAEMVRISVSTERLETTGFTLAAYRQLVADQLTLTPSNVFAPGPAVEFGVFLGTAWNSLWFGVVTTVASVTVGIALAHALAKYDLPAKGTLETIISFPISLPGIVAAFMMIVWFGKTGVVSNVLAVATSQESLAYALTAKGNGTPLAILGLFFGYCYSMISRATFILRGTYAEVNHAAEEAARTLGATPFQTFRHVTYPQIRPGVVGAAILTFRTSLAIFGTVLVLKSLDVATLVINRQVQVGFEIQVASAMGGVFFLFTFAVTFLGLQYTSAEVGT